MSGTYSISARCLLPGESELYSVEVSEQKDALRDILLCSSLLYTAHRDDVRIPFMRLSPLQINFDDCYLACRESEDIPVLHFKVQADSSTVISGNITRDGSSITNYSLSLVRKKFSVLIIGHESGGTIVIDSSKITDRHHGVRIKRPGIFSAESAERTQKALNLVSVGIIFAAALFFAYCAGLKGFPIFKAKDAFEIDGTIQNTAVERSVAADSDYCTDDETAADFSPSVSEDTAAAEVSESVMINETVTAEESGAVTIVETEAVSTVAETAVTALPETEKARTTESDTENVPASVPEPIRLITDTAEDTPAVIPSRVMPMPDTESSFTVKDFTGSFTVGDMAKLKISGKPNTVYTLTVYYSSGKSSASGLGDTLSDSEGNASWSWRIGGRTKPGTYRLVISCDEESEELQFTVKSK